MYTHTSKKNLGQLQKLCWSTVRSSGHAPSLTLTSWVNLTKGWPLDGYTEGVDSEGTKNPPNFYSLSCLDFLRFADRPCPALVHVHTVGTKGMRPLASSIQDHRITHHLSVWSQLECSFIEITKKCCLMEMPYCLQPGSQSHYRNSEDPQLNL